MSAKLNELVSELGSDLGSPRVVDDIDRVLVRLLKLRDFAAEHHGITAPSPVALSASLRQDADESARAKSPPIEDIAALADRYRADARSPYQQLRHKTRENYHSLIKRILNDCGPLKLASLKKEDFEQLYKSWKEGGKLAMAHSLVTMLRSMVSFGAIVIEDSECLRLDVVLHRMKFETIKPRSEQGKPRLTMQHVLAIRAQAHKSGHPSIALAQALQTECRLAQNDVIGEWVPHSEVVTQPSDELEGDMKWVRGIRWNQIDDHFILKHVTALKQEEVTIDLNQCPMVIEELRIVAGCKPHETLTRAKLPRAVRAVIKDDDTGKPFLAHRWRRAWRMVATEAGVPKDVENRDSRMVGGEAAPADRREKEAVR
jgi:hypothetical protein